MIALKRRHRMRFGRRYVLPIDSIVLLGRGPRISWNGEWGMHPFPFGMLRKRDNWTWWVLWGAGTLMDMIICMHCRRCWIVHASVSLYWWVSFSCFDFYNYYYCCLLSISPILSTSTSTVTSFCDWEGPHRWYDDWLWIGLVAYSGTLSSSSACVSSWMETRSGVET